MLVDAGARDFTWVDPTPSKIIETPPAISFTVSTAKFEGRVTILYDRGGDTYVVELHRQNGESVELVDRHDEVYFDMLGEVLERLIDDGRWRQIDVSILDAKAARKRVPSRHDAPQRNRAVLRLTRGIRHGVPAVPAACTTGPSSHRMEAFLILPHRRFHPCHCDSKALTCAPC